MFDMQEYIAAKSRQQKMHAEGKRTLM